ncbi:MAG: hypothetical protein ACRDQ5_26125, partial [Sciscionella sp.]
MNGWSLASCSLSWLKKNTAIQLKGRDSESPQEYSIFDYSGTAYVLVRDFQASERICFKSEFRGSQSSSRLIRELSASSIAGSSAGARCRTGTDRPVT